MDSIKNISARLLDAIFPPSITCICCDRELKKSDDRLLCLCENCLSSVSPVEKPIALPYDDFLCRCLLTSFIYEGAAKKITVGFKDGGKNYLGRYIARYLYDALALCPEGLPIDGICFVPSSKRKTAKRGYSFAEIIAKELSKLTLLPVIDCLGKKDNVPDQTEIKNRIENVKDVFFLKNAPQIKNVLLLDDVITSGATMCEISKLLHSEGISVTLMLTFSVSPSFDRSRRK